MSQARYRKTSLSRDVTDKEREMLVKLMEECAELSQATSKILRHGWDSWNPDRPEAGWNSEQILEEIADVQNMLKEIAPSIRSSLLRKQERGKYGHLTVLLHRVQRLLDSNFQTKDNASESETSSPSPSSHLPSRSSRRDESF
jgi:NTP pyrophosphatase (non-canonical NTP hydrolase)